MRIRRVALLMVPVIILLLSSSNQALACSCLGSSTVCGSYASAEAVFVGSVRRVEESRGKEDAGAGEETLEQIAYVRVERVFKGEPEEEVTFRAGMSSCDPDYREGQRWLFFAHYDKESKAWRIRACDRSQLVESAANDLLYLRALPESLQKTRISGTLAHYEDDPEKGFSRIKNIAGAKVKLIGWQNTYEVYTDSNGAYEIYDLPPGRYTIEPEIPRGLSLRSSYSDDFYDEKGAIIEMGPG
jgi:hypothetical protein